jgi:hypothetical protein
MEMTALQLSFDALDELSEQKDWTDRIVAAAAMACVDCLVVSHLAALLPSSRGANKDVLTTEDNLFWVHCQLANRHVNTRRTRTKDPKEFTLSQDCFPDCFKETAWTNLTLSQPVDFVVSPSSMLEYFEGKSSVRFKTSAPTVCFSKCTELIATAKSQTHVQAATDLISAVCEHMKNRSTGRVSYLLKRGSDRPFSRPFSFLALRYAVEEVSSEPLRSLISRSASILGAPFNPEEQEVIKAATRPSAGHVPEPYTDLCTYSCAFLLTLRAISTSCSPLQPSGRRRKGDKSVLGAYFDINSGLSKRVPTTDSAGNQISSVRIARGYEHVKAAVKRVQTGAVASVLAEWTKDGILRVLQQAIVSAFWRRESDAFYCFADEAITHAIPLVRVSGDQSMTDVAIQLADHILDAPVWRELETSPLTQYPDAKSLATQLKEWTKSPEPIDCKTIFERWEQYDQGSEELHSGGRGGAPSSPAPSADQHPDPTDSDAPLISVSSFRQRTEQKQVFRPESRSAEQAPASRVSESGEDTDSHDDAQPPIHLPLGSQQSRYSQLRHPSSHSREPSSNSAVPRRVSRKSSFGLRDRSSARESDSGSDVSESQTSFASKSTRRRAQKRIRQPAHPTASQLPVPSQQELHPRTHRRNSKGAEALLDIEPTATRQKSPGLKQGRAAAAEAEADTEPETDAESDPRTYLGPDHAAYSVVSVDKDRLTVRLKHIGEQSSGPAPSLSGANHERDRSRSGSTVSQSMSRKRTHTQLRESMPCEQQADHSDASDLVR